MIRDKQIIKALKAISKVIQVAREDASYPFGTTERVSETIRAADEALSLIETFISTNYAKDTVRAQIESLQSELHTLRVHHNQRCTCGALM